MAFTSKAHQGSEFGKHPAHIKKFLHEQPKTVVNKVEPVKNVMSPSFSPSTKELIKARLKK